MMKKISVFVALMALFFADLVLAAGAVVTTASGTVQVQTGPASPRPLRQGDEVAQGDTVITGAGSAAVLKFDDGQVAALTANSRMTITSYEYNPASATGNVLLSLVTGGMRAITGIIGRRSPNQVSYRAATATIGIRGTDTTIATSGGDVIVSVSEGSVSFNFQGQVLTISAGEAVFQRPGQPAVRGNLGQVLTQTPPAIREAVTQVAQLSSFIAQSNPGQPRSGTDAPPAAPPAPTTPTPAPAQPAGGAGGGTASPG